MKIETKKNLRNTNPSFYSYFGIVDGKMIYRKEVVSVFGKPLHSSTRNLQHAQPLCFDNEDENTKNLNTSLPSVGESDQSDEYDLPDTGIDILNLVMLNYVG